jgi:hypothetical protein
MLIFVKESGFWQMIPVHRIRSIELIKIVSPTEIFLMGLIADGTLLSLNCDFQWDNCQELYHSSIPNKKI